MSLYTGKGDNGTTKLFDAAPGVRASKASPIFEALGACDELNTTVGWAKVIAGELRVGERSCAEILHEVQDHLFTLQAELAGAEKAISKESVEQAEATIHAIEAELPEITTFLVPGGTELSARLDMARALSRRAERRVVAVHESGERVMGEQSLRYANRLSSLLYSLVRLENHRKEVGESAPRYR